MDPGQEPVRGGVLPPAAFALEGLARLRGFGQGLWPSTPMHHLTGFRTTQATNGSAVASLPASPWLMHPDGVTEVGLMATATCGAAAITGVPKGMRVVPIHMAYGPLRQVDPSTRHMVGRAHVLRTAPNWVYVEGSVEDDQGRVLADAAGQFSFAPVPFRVPEAPPALSPCEVPKYPSPDPHERPLPAEVYAGCEQFRAEGASAWMGAIREGEAPLPPLYQLLGIRPLDIDEGHATTALTTSSWHEALEPGMFPGFLDAFAVDACGAAAWTHTPAGSMPATMHVQMTHFGVVPADGRTLTAHARSERVDDFLLMRVDVHDGEQRVVSGTSTARVIEDRSTRIAQPTRVLATVLFTDIVDSTEAASRAGDAAWGELLQQHHATVRAALADHAGREIKTTGDGFLATFDSPTRAVECARAINADVRRLGIRLRIGVHTGEVEISGGDVSGNTVNLAARVEAAAGPDEVWVSETTRALTAGSGLTFDDRGPHDLKGFDEPVRLFRLAGN